MREILFRGKRIDNNLWAYGYAVKYEKCLWIYTGEIHTIEGHVNEYGLPLTREKRYEADLETVCQYTGMTDKNGKKIFEGDIISTPKYGVDNGNWKNCAGKDRFLVRYADGTYYLENKLRRFCLRPDSTCEIIGNIFDNPELIASKKGAEA